MKKKVIVSCLALALIILCSFLGTKSESQLLSKFKSTSGTTSTLAVSTESSKSLILLSELFENMSLHIDDSEVLRNAFAAQALVGPLVRFSNLGRYEPYVAKTWSQSGNEWTFEIHDELKCEDGQPMGAESFRASLKRSLLRFSRLEIKETPFANLKGIEKFLATKNDADLGISVSGKKLRFLFTKPVGKSLLEYLAMTPFAFLCESNFDGDLWNSQGKFVSSGPYRLAAFNSGTDLVQLELRKDWVLNPSGAIDTVYLTKKRLANYQPSAEIEMSYSFSKSGATGNIVREVPRAFLSLRLGTGENKFFSSRKNRQALKDAVNEVLDHTEVPFENYHRATSFFFGQVTGLEAPRRLPSKVRAPKEPLIVRARAPGKTSEIDFYQGILFKALEGLNWKYSLDTTPVKKASQYYNVSYDITYDRSYVDATLDPEFVRMLFKSNLGPRYQDPDQRISKLFTEFDKGTMPYRDFLISFNAIISEEAAIIPMYHRGFTWKFTDNLEVKNISPLMSIIRYEELLIKNDGS